MVTSSSRKPPPKLAYHISHAPVEGRFRAADRKLCLSPIVRSYKPGLQRPPVPQRLHLRCSRAMTAAAVRGIQHHDGRAMTRGRQRSTFARLLRKVRSSRRNGPPRFPEWRMQPPMLVRQSLCSTLVGTSVLALLAWAVPDSGVAQEMPPPGLFPPSVPSSGTVPPGVVPRSTPEGPPQTVAPLGVTPRSNVYSPPVTP